MARYVDAQLAVTGAIVDAVNASVPDGKPGNAKAESGLAKVREGVATTLIGVVSTLATAGLTDGWRRDRLPALSAVAPKAGKLFAPDQCHRVRDAAAETAQALGDATVAAGLRSFGQSLGCAA